MSITSSEIQYRMSGGATNTAAASSLGGAQSSTTFGTTVFANVGSSEQASGSVKYRCIYIHNNNATTTLTGAVAWVNSDTPSSATAIALGLGSSGMNGTEQTISNETTAPSGVAFSAAASKAAGIALGDIPAGGSVALWVRRTINAGAPSTSSDPFTIRVEGSTT